MFSFFKRKKAPAVKPAADEALLDKETPPVTGADEATAAQRDAPLDTQHAPNRDEVDAGAPQQTPEQAARLSIEAEAARLEAEQAEAERAEAQRAEAQRAEAKRAEAERVRVEHEEATRLEAARQQAEQAAAEAAEAERLKLEQLAAERAETARIESERLEAERLEAERLEAERVEAERVEAERVEAQQAEAARLEAERQAEQTPARTKTSWLSRLSSGLSRTGQSISTLFVGVKVDEALFEELETALIMADAGVEATNQLLTALRARVRKEKITDAAKVKTVLREVLAQHLTPLEKPFPIEQASPLVVMIAGVNGAGKTTSIGKLANAFQRQGKSVLLAAGDTFRAAAREQLIAWGDRNNVTVIAQDGGDPAAVAFDAVNAGRARGANVVMVDTAGRLPTQLHLMEELKKIKRVIGKADGQAPHEVLLVVDGNTGQNAISQIRAFDAAIELTGLVVTKLDGTAKGGALAAVAAGSQGVRPVPVYWIGVGEGLEDLQPFVAREFAAAVVGD